VARVLQHLSLPLEKDRLLCAVSHKDGNFRRFSKDRGEEQEVIVFSSVSLKIIFKKQTFYGLL